MSIVGAIERVSAASARATGAVIVAMAVLCMGSLVYQVFTRYILGNAAPWTEELALFLFTWIVLLAGSLGVREGFHVRLALVLSLLPGSARRFAERVIGLIVIGFGATLLVSGVAYVDRTLGQVSAAVRYPIEALHLAAPVCGALIIVHGIAGLFASPTTADRGSP